MAYLIEKRALEVVARGLQLRNDIWYHCTIITLASHSSCNYCKHFAATPRLFLGQEHHTIIMEMSASAFSLHCSKWGLEYYYVQCKSVQMKQVTLVLLLWG